MLKIMIPDKMFTRKQQQQRVILEKKRLAENNRKAEIREKENEGQSFLEKRRYVIYSNRPKFHRLSKTNVGKLFIVVDFVS